jgi:putative transcriptional regulator
VGNYKGRLLVATPKLLDPNFERTVVYVCFHDENGSFGLVLNRPVEEVDISDHLPQWGGRVTPPRVPFLGGPVETTAALGLVRGAGGEEPGGWTPVGAGLGLVNLAHPPEESQVALEDLRIFLGYSGWGGGQLDAEIADGAWLVVDTAAGDLFSAHPEDLWRDVLRRQKGDVALLAFTPRDPRAN